MTLSSPAGYLGDEQQAAVAGLPQRGPEPWRLSAALAIVAIVVAAIWLWGRPHAEPPPALVAVTSEAWMAGQSPGAFEVVGVPEALATRFVDPDAIVGRAVAHDVPAGTFVTPALLKAPQDVAGAVTLIQFAAETGAWPAPGPGAGSRAVLSTVLGGCAIDVTTLADGDDGRIVVRVDAPFAARLAAAVELGGLVVWPAPPDGWPLCPSGRSTRLAPSTPGADAPAPLPSFNPAGS